jgi:hypothetical protein
MRLGTCEDEKSNDEEDEDEDREGRERHALRRSFRITRRYHAV